MSKKHFECIMNALEEGDRLGRLTVIKPELLEGDLPPTEVRTLVMIDGSSYAVTITAQEARTVGDDQVILEDAKPGPGLIQPRTFMSDHRNNPKLHALYVSWARDSIQIINQACQQLWDLSRWPESDIASALWKNMKDHMETDAAWFEAAALEFMEPNAVMVARDFQIHVGESLRNVPPGEYTGHLEEKDGKLFFELDEELMVQGD